MKKVRSRKKSAVLHAQVAALPVRASAGKIEVLLITSRATRRWIIPKGWPIDDLSPSESAAREAFEEAGVEGSIESQPCGSFIYEKILTKRRSITCDVKVFILMVERQAADWPEASERDTRWLPVADAARMVSDRDLAPIIKGLHVAA